MQICDFKKCTGCELCSSVCPNHAITMKPDEHGFMHPIINSQKCISCNLCLSLCPQNNATLNNSPLGSYAAFSKNNHYIKNSSSGGIFSVLANYVINQGGVVFGVCWDKNLNPVFSYGNTASEIEKFRGSKYVPARVGSAYEDCKNFLMQKKLVLFTGCPCHIDALKKYLTKDYDNLITVDVVCHGVPSPMVFDSYKKALSKKYNDTITDIKFRFKNPDWLSGCVNISFKNSENYIESTYYDKFFIGFNYCFYLRKSCHNCKYASIHRPGDLTVSDFWGYRADNWHMHKYYKGCSAVIINSEKGQQIFNTNKKALKYEKCSLEKIIEGNRSLSKPWDPHDLSETFWKEYLDSKDFEDVSSRLFEPVFYPLSAFEKNKMKYHYLNSFVPIPLKVFIAKLLHK